MIFKTVFLSSMVIFGSSISSHALDLSSDLRNNKEFTTSLVCSAFFGEVTDDSNKAEPITSIGKEIDTNVNKKNYFKNRTTDFKVFVDVKTVELFRTNARVNELDQYHYDQTKYGISMAVNLGLKGSMMIVDDCEKFARKYIDNSPS